MPLVSSVSLAGMPSADWWRWWSGGLWADLETQPALPARLARPLNALVFCQPRTAMYTDSHLLDAIYNV